jgi:hypothetical protein
MHIRSDITDGMGLRSFNASLACLQEIGNLDRVEFILEEPELDKDEENIEEFAFGYHIVQKELARVAQLLVSDSDNDTTKRCFMKVSTSERYHLPSTKHGLTSTVNCRTGSRKNVSTI